MSGAETVAVDNASFPLPDGLRLLLTSGEDEADYPTGRLQKGLLLADGDQELAEEGVGFGVPLVKRGAQTVFPGSRRVTCRSNGAAWEVRAAYGMDLVERLKGTHGAPVQSGSLYVAKDALAALHRRVPALRPALTALSGGLRSRFGWVTTYERTQPLGVVTVTSRCDDDGRVSVEIDAGGLRRDGLTELVVMNEQGARRFDRYSDADGAALEGEEIGAWRQVTAAEACFSGSAHDVVFSLRQVEGARLYRGRELIGDRLAWAGFGYSFAPAASGLAYDIIVSRAP